MSNEKKSKVPIAAISSICIIMGLLPVVEKEYGHNPFSTKERAYNNAITTFDNNGNSSVENIYETKNQDNNNVMYIEYYSGWYKDYENERYLRTKRTYSKSIGKIKDEITPEIIQNEEIDLYKVFGTPDSIEVEQKSYSEITDNDLNIKPIIRCMKYEIDKNDYIMVEQSANEAVKDIINYVRDGGIASGSIVGLLYLSEGLIKKRNKTKALKKAKDE